MCSYRDAGSSKMSGPIRRKLLFALVWFVVAASVSDGLGAVEAQMKSFPVPVRIDFGRCLPTSLYVKCKCKQYDLSYPEFVARRMGQAESAFKEVVSAIAAKDPNACLQLCRGSSGLTDEQQQRYTKNINLLIKAFADTVLGEQLNKVRIDVQYYVGHTRLFIWGLDNPPRRPAAFRTWMTFRRNSAGQLRWTPRVDRLDDFSMLLVSIMRQRARTDKQFQAVTKPGCTYEFALANTIEGDQAHLQFSGKVYDCNIFEERVDPADEILSFYQAAYHVLRDKSVEDFVKFYTRKSAEKYRQWLTGKHKKYAKWYHQDLIESGRKVLFIMDAEPFYFVFYRKNRSSDKAIRFEDIVRDPSDNKLKLTNYNYLDYLHEFLKNKELFINPILKPLLRREQN
jgi:hypothetical protein